jgi:hypothetical protein
MPRTSISRKQAFTVADYIKSTYVDSGLDNVAFAKQATEYLGLTIRKITIANLLEDLEIPANHGRRKPTDSVGDCLALTARVQALEEQMQKLTRLLRSTSFPSKEAP